MQIFVVTLTGKTTPFEVGTSEPIHDVKAKIQETKCIRPDQQRLISVDTLLENSLDDTVRLLPLIFLSLDDLHRIPWAVSKGWRGSVRAEIEKKIQRLYVHALYQRFLVGAPWAPNVFHDVSRRFELTLRDGHRRHIDSDTDMVTWIVDFVVGVRPHLTWQMAEGQGQFLLGSMLSSYGVRPHFLRR